MLTVEAYGSTVNGERCEVSGFKIVVLIAGWKLFTGFVSMLIGEYTVPSRSLKSDGDNCLGSAMSFLMTLRAISDGFVKGVGSLVYRVDCWGRENFRLYFFIVLG